MSKKLTKKQLKEEAMTKGLTNKQIRKIRLKLRDDILDRYDNLEYWDMDLLRSLIRDEGLEDDDDIEAAIDKVVDYSLDD